MRKPTIDMELLDEMLSAGKTGRQCAKHFGVTDQAISAAKKRLGLAMVSHAAVEAAPAVMQSHIDIFAQMKKSNAVVNEIMDKCMGWIRGEDVSIQVLESQLRTINVGTRDEPLIQEIVTSKDPMEIALKCAALIVSQSDRQFKWFESWAKMQIVFKFMNEVVDIIDECSPELRAKFVERCRHKGIVQPAFSVH